MNFEKVFSFLLDSFVKHNIRYALMGGFALHAAGFSRSTQDIDILILRSDMPKVKKLLLSLGYDLAHESEDVLNFKGAIKELGQVDFLLAHRPYAKKMLQRAKEHGILKDKFRVKVLMPEDIIGLKVQASTNDPSRHAQDLADIETLLRLHKNQLDLELLKEYFSLFDRREELEQILQKIDHA